MQPSSTLPDTLLAKLLARIPTPPPPYSASTSPSASIATSPPASIPRANMLTPPGSPPLAPIDITVDNATTIIGHRNTVHLPASHHPFSQMHAATPTLPPAVALALAHYQAYLRSLPNGTTQVLPPRPPIPALGTEFHSQMQAVARLLATLRNSPSTKDRTVNIKVMGGVRVCGSGNTLVVGGTGIMTPGEASQPGGGERAEDGGEVGPGAATGKTEAATGEKRKRDDKDMSEIEMPEMKKSA